MNTSPLNGAPFNFNGPFAPAWAPRPTSFRSTGVTSSPSPSTDRRPDPGYSTGKATSFRSTGTVASPSPSTDRRPDAGYSTGKAT